MLLISYNACAANWVSSIIDYMNICIHYTRDPPIQVNSDEVTHCPKELPNISWLRHT